ncbi:MAG: hypothetical protein IID61_14490 [SAR324 cluster bacterium]|nr:hypothetical protein [SAR324 cluster bacterium]
MAVQTPARIFFVSIFVSAQAGLAGLAFAGTPLPPRTDLEYSSPTAPLGLTLFPQYRSAEFRGVLTGTAILTSPVPKLIWRGKAMIQAEEPETGGGGLLDLAEDEPFFSEGEGPIDFISPDDPGTADGGLSDLVEDEPFFSEGDGPLDLDATEAPEPGGVLDDDEPFLSDEPQPLSTELGDSDDLDGDEGYLRRKVFFRQRYRVLGGVNRTTGIFIFFTGRNELRELRLLNSYQQTIRIEESPTNYKFVKFSIDFTQNYDVESEQFFDTYFVFNEIYLNMRKDKNQFRWGNQIHELGKVDFDSPIDVLHFTNIVGFLTFDAETTKQSIPSLRYDRFFTDQRLTFYAAPIAQRTFGMRFTDFRDDADARDEEKRPDPNSFLRDYAGIQHQWMGRSYDLRVGFFHWFDNSPKVSFQFESDPQGVDTSSFDKLVETYEERESHTNFFTLEVDMIFGSIGWKADLGLFDQKNFYDYQQPADGDVDFDTVNVPHIGMATSLEKTFPFFFTLVVYSYRKLFDVPPDTHILLYENEKTPSGRKRDLEKQSLTGVFKWRILSNHNATLALSRTFPFVQNGVFAIWAWEQPEFNSEWALKIFHFRTETLKITGDPIESTQVFLSYTRNFTAT